VPTTSSTIPFLSDCLTDTAARLPDKVAMVFEDARVTYGEFNTQVDNLAGALLDLGVERGDRVGIVCSTRPEYLVVYLAAARVGAILVGFSVAHTHIEIERLLDLTRPVVLFAIDRFHDREIASMVAETAAPRSYVRTIVTIPSSSDNESAPFRTLVSTSADDGPTRIAERRATLDPDDGVLIVFTSGSTGVPKAAELTHRNIVTNIIPEIRELGLDESGVVMLHLPMNHVSAPLRPPFRPLSSAARW